MNKMLNPQEVIELAYKKFKEEERFEDEAIEDYCNMICSELSMLPEMECPTIALIAHLDEAWDNAQDALEVRISEEGEVTFHDVLSTMIFWKLKEFLEERGEWK